jgi:hypothetical protein
VSDVALLRRKRELLQLRLRRRELARRFRVLAPKLRAAGVRRLSPLPPARARALIAPFAHWPGRDERFYWAEIPGHHWASWDTGAEPDAVFREALRTCFQEGERLAFVFHTAQTALVLGWEDAIAHAGTLLPELYGSVWIVSARQPELLLEVCPGDRELCWRALAYD